jgi:hypothetical protein
MRIECCKTGSLLPVVRLAPTQGCRFRPPSRVNTVTPFFEQYETPSSDCTGHFCDSDLHPLSQGLRLPDQPSRSVENGSGQPGHRDKLRDEAHAPPRLRIANPPGFGDFESAPSCSDSFIWKKPDTGQFHGESPKLAE